MVTLASGTVLSGTVAGDFFIRHKRDSSNTLLVVSFELKKEVKTGDLYQASAEVVAMETLLARTVPVFLTDLNKVWRFVYHADDGNITYVDLSRDEAVHTALALTSSFTAPTTAKSHTQWYSTAPFPTFALQLKQKPPDSETNERLMDELDVMQMSGSTFDEMRAFVLSRVIFGGISVSCVKDEAWRNMYV